MFIKQILTIINALDKQFRCPARTIQHFRMRLDSKSFNLRIIGNFNLFSILYNSVHNLLISQKVITGKKINVLPKKTVAKKEEVAAPVEAAAAPVASTEAAVGNEVAPETPAQ